MTDSNAHFRSVLRGYDPAQVDQLVHELTQAAAAARQEAGERTIQVSKLEAAHGQLRTEVEHHAQHARALEEAQKNAAAPTFAGLGERIGSILELADKEASEMRTRAQADAAHHHALADESALATRQSADDYATETRSAVDSEVARILEDAKRHADSLLDDADRESMARREEAEAVYERARAKSAAAAVDFETTLAARRDASALEHVAEMNAAEQQLAAVQLRSEQLHKESEQAQQEAASRSAQQLEQATAQSLTVVAEAKTKAERIRGDSERELAAATQRRDSINAQLTNVRQMLATLGGAAMVTPLEAAEVAVVHDQVAPEVEQQVVATNVQGGEDSTPNEADVIDPAQTSEAKSVEAVAESDETTDDKADENGDENGTENRNHSGRKVGAKR
jgi:DivIVA domain-containing protein